MGSALTVRGREIRHVERTRDADFRPRLHWRGASRQHWTSRRSHRLQIRLRRAGPEIGSTAAPLARLGCPAGAQDSGRSDLHARAVADRQRGNFRCAVCASGLGSGVTVTPDRLAEVATACQVGKSRSEAALPGRARLDPDAGFGEAWRSAEICRSVSSRLIHVSSSHKAAFCPCPCNLANSNFDALWKLDPGCWACLRRQYGNWILDAGAARYSWKVDSGRSR